MSEWEAEELERKIKLFFIFLCVAVVAGCIVWYDFITPNDRCAEAYGPEWRGHYPPGAWTGKGRYVFVPPSACVGPDGNLKALP